MRFTALLVVIFLAAFTGTALATEAVSAAADPPLFEAAKAVFDAVVSGQWWAAAALAVVLLVAGVRKYMPASWKAGAKGDLIGVGTAALMSFASAIAVWALAQPAGAVMSTGVILTALKVAGTAIGGYTAIHKIAQILVAWGKLPAWALALVKLLTALVGSNAIKKAEAAGDKAVAEAPPKGMPGDERVIEVE